MNCLGREVTCFYATILQKKEYFCESIIYGMKIDNLEDIKNLIVQTENEQLEFKETTGQLEKHFALSLMEKVERFYSVLLTKGK